ncbi:rifampin ADP-ribosylating transferase [Chryseobacterium contaminans]|uniref:Rifampin ADP-ribosylating transferase n=1 Tax=Chryseobacterium contaminans TaxID=1423959 RepID=A0A1M6XYC6_9FLAO|nr:NAD(+)--rifampin ADP-ribosyltransferase [Chryseobacterium contaminans]SHL10815.1 rifampin ADP-ribosylating transferase [Chryseobacterium contaminans]
MEFSPFNNVVKLCIQGMIMEDQDKQEEAGKFFEQSWNEAADNAEKFLAAYYIARSQKISSERLKWFETALQYALKSNDNTVKSAFYSLYVKIAECYEELSEPEKAKEYNELALSVKDKIFDHGPFYHGTKADLQTGDLLTAGGNSNYKADFRMNHIYFTALVNGAGLAAALAKGDGAERVYIVEPTGAFENDPNLTDKKFPGNMTRSYRSEAPLKIIGEVTEWNKPGPEELQKFRGKLENNKGEIIN